MSGGDRARLALVHARSLGLARALALAPALLLAAAGTARAGEPVPPAGAKVPETPAPVAANADDVNFELDTARPRPSGLLRNGPVSLLDPWFEEGNRWAKETLALEFGLAYTAAWQDASDGDIGHAGAGDVDLFARWRLLGGETSGWRGVFGINAEGRHDFGADTPRDLGDSFGSLWRTTNNFGTQPFSVVQNWWEQHLFDDRVVATIGKIDPTNYYDTHRYQNDATTFLSRAFSNNPTRGHPNNGLGLTAKGRLCGDLFLSAGVHDANGVKTHSGFSTIGEGEWFGAAELSWTPKFEGMGKGAYRFTYWGIEHREDEGAPSDTGFCFGSEQEVGGGFVPFLRASASEGEVTGVRRFACGGLGLEGVLGTKKDLTGIGVSWGEPDDPVRRNQWGGEVFHRIQLAPDVQFTIGYQYVRRPSDPTVDGDDPVGILEIRIRVSF